MADPLPPTRKELATFLSDQRLIRAFEKLFEIVPGDLESLEDRIEVVEIRSKSNQVLIWISCD